jgi:hypothetical protein
MGTPVIQGQQSVQQFPAFAMPGQLADLAYNEIVYFPAAEVIQPGRCVELASDGISCQQAQQTGSTFSPVGVSILITAREAAGSFGITPYGIGGPQYNIGDSVPVLMRGRIYAEWKGTTQPAFGMPNVYHSSTLSADRGKLTDASTSTVAGSEVANAGHMFRVRQALPGSGDIVLVDVNLPGAA